MARMITPILVKHRSKEIGSLGERLELLEVYGELFLLEGERFEVDFKYGGRRTCGYLELGEVSHLIISEF